MAPWSRTAIVAAPGARPASAPPTMPPGSESADVEEEWEEEEGGEKRPLSPRPLSPVPAEEERESGPQESRVRRMANALMSGTQLLADPASIARAARAAGAQQARISERIYVD